MAFLNETKLARYTEKLWAQILAKLKVDTTLTEENMAADAKAVGDAILNLENYILTIDYDNTLSFDTSEIVVNTGTSSILGTAILGQIVLA